MYKKLVIIFILATQYQTSLFTQAKNLKNSAQSNLLVKPDEIWDALKKKPAPRKAELKKVFIDQIEHLAKLYGNLNSAIPKHTTGKGALRVVTYNVHGFKDPVDKANFWKIYDVLKDINADIIILQEAIFDDIFRSAGKGNFVVRDRFTKLGYTHVSFVGASHKASHFGNCILSKYKFACAPYKRNFNYKGNIHKRAFVKIELDLSRWKKADLAIYGTHFEVSSPPLRLEEARELVHITDTYDTNKNIMIAADFNETRQGQALQVLEKNGFVDTFSLAHLPEPYFTHWSGKPLDYLYVKNKDLWIAGSYVYYDHNSDHMPVIVDIKL